MTDTTKPIDLSTLEQGDTVVFRDGQKAIVNHISDNFVGGFSVHFSYTSTLNYQRNNDYLQNGETQFSFNTDNDIVEIIKNPKRWTDEDMKESFIMGYSHISEHNEDCDYEKFANDWLQQYKERKHEQ